MANRPHGGFSVAVCAGALLLPATLAWAQAPAVSPAEAARFLETAEIIDAVPIGQGVTKPWRLTLRDGTRTHDAQFQSVDQTEAVRRLGRSRELNFVDSYRYNIAAYRLASLIGLGHMMPVTVERTWDGKRGALSWWIDDVMFTEQARQEERRWPEDMKRWNDQMYRMWTFAELVHDTDRNQGNMLYTRDWTLYMIDFSRASRLWDELLRPDELVRCDRAVFARLKTLTREEVIEATDPYLRPDEVDAVLHRRDLLIDHFEAHIEARDEDRILY